MCCRKQMIENTTERRRRLGLESTGGLREKNVNGRISQCSPEGKTEERQILVLNSSA